MKVSPGRVLIVDACDVQRRHIEQLCRELGFAAVESVACGETALALLRERDAQFDALIVDLEMPRIDGVELMQEVARLGLDLPVVVASARETSLLAAVEVMSRSLGLNRLSALPKPLSTERLAEALQRRAPAATADDTGPRYGIADLERALDAGQFLPFYQPKLSLRPAIIRGVEALIRWRHPEHGLVPPSCFIETLEGSALMHRLTLDLLDQVLLQCRRWHEGGLRIGVALNVSPRSLCDEGLTNEIVRRVSHSGVAPQYITLEITETAIMADLGTALGNLVRLRLKGFGLAIDDYGTGFSSMQQLAQAPFTELKIDRAFVHQASRRPQLRILLESAIQMARRLELTVVAEGVETAEDWQLLRALRCEQAQGFLIAQALPGDALVDWLKASGTRLRRL